MEQGRRVRCWSRDFVALRKGKWYRHVQATAPFSLFTCRFHNDLSRRRLTCQHPRPLRSLLGVRFLRWRLPTAHNTAFHWSIQLRRLCLLDLLTVPIVIVLDARATQPSSRNERRCNRYERPSSRRFPSVLYAHHLRFSGRHLHPSCRTAVSVCSDCGLEFGSEGLLLSSAYCGLPRFAQRERQSQERRERFEPLVVVRGEETQHHGLLLNTRY